MMNINSAEAKRPLRFGGTKTEVTLKNDGTNAINIKVIGIGDAGCSVINRMVNDGVQNMEFIAINADKQVLNASKAGTVIQIGKEKFGGRGGVYNPESGQKAAEESRWEIIEALLRTDLLFIVAGMGGGTGTGAAPVVAEIARGMNILTIAMVTKPLSDEGSGRMNYAEQGIAILQKEADSLIVIPNDRIQETFKPKGGRAGIFEEADKLFKQGIISLSNMLSADGFINLDFEDLCWVCRKAGLAYMGVGYASGKDKAETAVSMALSSPLLETSIIGAKAALVNITASPDLLFSDANIVSQRIEEALDPDPVIFWGLFYDESMTDEMQVTVIATHLEDCECEAAEAEPEPAQGAELVLESILSNLSEIFQ